MQITRMFVPKYKYDIKCPYEMQPEFIIVHNTENDASAMAEISYMIGNNKKVSFHCAVDNIRIVQGVMFNRNTWNAGDGVNGDGNRKGISIEICYSKSGGEEFEDAQRLTAEYIAYLLKQYNWGIDKVKKHQDFSNKNCPRRTLEEGWRTYQNGSTSEIVYADTDCTKRIGSLDPRERCDCFGTFYDKAMVRYKVNGTNNYKIGFCKWLGGVK